MGINRSSMAGAIARTTLQSVKPHVPMIKFPPRTSATPKLKEAPKEANANVSAVNSLLNTVMSTKSSTSKSKGPAIDSSELPQRYRRKPITGEEMEYIEKGGKV